MGTKIDHLVDAAFIKDGVPLRRMEVRVEGLADFLHGHAHDTVDIFNGEEFQAGGFPLENLVPGFGYGGGGIPQGSVQVKKQQRLQKAFPPFIHGYTRLCTAYYSRGKKR